MKIIIKIGQMLIKGRGFRRVRPVVKPEQLELSLSD